MLLMLQGNTKAHIELYFDVEYQGLVCNSYHQGWGALKPSAFPGIGTTAQYLRAPTLLKEKIMSKPSKSQCNYSKLGYLTLNVSVRLYRWQVTVMWSHTLKIAVPKLEP